MRFMLGLIGWIAAATGTILVLVGLACWPPGGLFFAAPYIFLIPGVPLCGLGTVLILLLRRRQHLPNSTDGAGESEVAQEDTVVLKESRSTLVIAGCVCMILLIIGSLSIGGAFHWAAIGFILFVTLLIFHLVTLASCVTVLAPRGISGRSLGKSWHYEWGQLDSWGLDYLPNGEYSIWIRARNAQQRRYIQALREDATAKVRLYLARHLGEAQLNGQDNR